MFPRITRAEMERQRLQSEVHIVAVEFNRRIRVDNVDEIEGIVEDEAEDILNRDVNASTGVSQMQVTFATSDVDKIGEILDRVNDKIEESGKFDSRVPLIGRDLKATSIDIR